MIALKKYYARPNARGTKHRAAKLTEGKVSEMRRAYRSGGLSVARIAEIAGVNNHTAWCALYGRTWRHVGGEAKPVGGGNVAMRKLADPQVREARRLYASGMASIREIREMLGISFNAARLMLIGETYRHVPMPRDDYNVALSENIREGIIRRLHLQHYSGTQRMAIEMAFLAGVRHGMTGGEARMTHEEVMGAGNSEYDNHGLSFEDLAQLSHAYAHEED